MFFSSIYKKLLVGSREFHCTKTECKGYPNIYFNVCIYHSKNNLNGIINYTLLVFTQNSSIVNLCFLIVMCLNTMHSYFPPHSHSSFSARKSFFTFLYFLRHSFLYFLRHSISLFFLPVCLYWYQMH